MDLVDLFPRTIAVAQLKTLSPEFIQKATAFIDQCPMQDLGADGGYTENQQILDEPIFDEVREEVLAAAKRLSEAYSHIVEKLRVCNSWANVVGENESIRYHRHDNSYISGVFYLSKGARFNLLNNFHNDLFGIVPRVANNPQNFRALESLDIEPEPGRVVLFPSGMYHCVVASRSEEKRYSVAFNTIPVGEVGRPTSIVKL